MSKKDKEFKYIKIRQWSISLTGAEEFVVVVPFYVHTKLLMSLACVASCKIGQISNMSQDFKRFHPPRYISLMTQMKDL